MERDILAKTMQEISAKCADQLGNIADEMRRRDLAQEYFSIMNKISEFVTVLDEITVRGYLERLNIEVQKMTEQEILFLATNFPNKELREEIKKVALSREISADEVGKEFLKSAVIVETFYTRDTANLTRYYFTILVNNDLTKGSTLWLSDDFLKARIHDHVNGLAIINFLIDDFIAGDYINSGKVFNRIFNVRSSAQKSQIQKEYLELWKEKTKDLKRDDDKSLKRLCCEWEEFEKEVEFNKCIKNLRKVCIDMQMAAMLAKFNTK